jgi:hypothetical protein
MEESRGGDGDASSYVGLGGRGNAIAASTGLGLGLDSTGGVNPLNPALILAHQCLGCYSPGHVYSAGRLGANSEGTSGQARDAASM